MKKVLDILKNSLQINKIESMTNIEKNLYEKKVILKSYFYFFYFLNSIIIILLTYRDNIQAITLFLIIYIVSFYFCKYYKIEY